MRPLIMDLIPNPIFYRENACTEIHTNYTDISFCGAQFTTSQYWLRCLLGTEEVPYVCSSKWWKRSLINFTRWSGLMELHVGRMSWAVDNQLVKSHVGGVWPLPSCLIIHWLSKLPSCQCPSSCHLEEHIYGLVQERRNSSGVMSFLH